MPSSPENLTTTGPSNLERLVLRKVTLRLIPFLCVLYFINILDRVNIGFARLQMLGDLDISEGAYAFGAGIFSVGYCVLEVPSNLLLCRMGARRWIARILVSWGVISAGMMFVEGPWSFGVLRFLLGCAEAGFFPGIVLYLTYWFPAERRARAVALLMVASPVVWMIGGPLTGALLQFMHERGGLAGWQWVFLLEGLPAVLLGVVTLFHLTDRPEDAHWLSTEERAWLIERLAREEAERSQRAGPSFAKLPTDGRVWHLILLAGTIAMGISGLTYYYPKLLETRFPHLELTEIGWLTALSGTVTLIALVAAGFHSDRSGERRRYVAGLAILAAVGWGLSIRADFAIVSFIGLIVAQAAMQSMWGPFWTMPTAFLSGRAAAGGIALINALGNLGAFVGPIVMGWLLQKTGDFGLSLAAMAGTMILCALLALAVRPSAASS